MPDGFGWPGFLLQLLQTLTLFFFFKIHPLLGEGSTHPASQLHPAQRRLGTGLILFLCSQFPIFSAFFLLLFIVFKSSLSAFPCISDSNSSHLESREESHRFYKSPPSSVLSIVPALSMQNYDREFGHSWLNRECEISPSWLCRDTHQGHLHH